MKAVFQHLRKAVRRGEVEGITDGQLLKRFLDGRDERAFEALVLRHGPMVLGVCRRVLANAHDAEDAFQAAFLVLVRKAGSIGKAELLGNWLYGVAYRTALEAKGKTARRRSREKQVRDMPHPAVAPGPDRAELVALLDGELSRLPDKYRVPVVLCELQGGARKEVARQLGLPEGTLSSRLATARKMLAKRLARHGLTVSGGALAAALTPGAASACLPAALVASTVSTAAGVAAARAITTAVVSAKVAGLTEGVLKAMFLAKLKTGAALLLPVMVAAAGAGLLTYRTAAAGPAGSVQQQAHVAPRPRPRNAEGKPKAEKPAVELPPGLEFLRPYPEFHEFRFGQDEATIRAIAARHSLTIRGAARGGFVVTRKDGERLSLSMRDGTCCGIQRLGPGPAAQDGTKGGETPPPPNNKARAAAEEAAREAAAREAAAKAAAVKASRAKETPTFPTPAKAADLKVDFEEVSISIRPPGIAARQPESVRLRGDGICEYRIDGRPARGTWPAWPPAYQEHPLDPKRLDRLEELLKKTAWLTAAGHEGPATHTDAARYTLTVKRKGRTRTITLDGEKGEPYRSLVAFFHAITLQENLLYRLERLPGREQHDACREIDQYVRAERGERYAKPPFEIDLRRYVPTFRRYVRDSFDRPTAEVAPAVRLLGHLRSEPDREYIAALANDRDQHVRVAVAEALGALGGKESVPVLRRMLRSTDGAAWQLIRLGPLAVPTVVEVIEGGPGRPDAPRPDPVDSQRLIRAYVDHWAEVPRPLDPRVLEAVRKSLAAPKVKAHGTEYHKQLLDLASRPAPPK
jgi:RNA polymerase sigma factor (sigma-70 family)